MCCCFYRVALELMVPGACQDRLDQRYVVFSIHDALKCATFDKKIF